MRDPHDGELRERLAAELKRDEVPTPVWEILETRGHIEAVRSGRLSSDRLVDYARALLFYSDIVEQVESFTEPEDARRTIDPPPFDSYEQERAETLGEYLNLRATAYPGVQEFREYALPRYADLPLLTPYQAHHFVRDFIFFKPKVVGDERFHIRSPRYDPSADRSRPSGRLKFFSFKPGEYEYIDFYQGSVVEWLHELSRELVEKLCPSWGEAEAAWFVLTGEAAVPKALVGEAEAFASPHLTYGTVNLKVEPWIAAETAIKAYQYLQMRMLGRKPRALSRRNLAVARFVMRELRMLILSEAYDDEKPRRLSWRILMYGWNRTNQESTYEDERQFYRDFYRAARAVVRPFDADSFFDQVLERPAKLSIPEASE